jgi:hypothetical protein
VVCSNGLEERNASICEIAAPEQVDAEEVGGRTVFLLRQWEYFTNFLKAKAADICL